MAFYLIEEKDVGRAAIYAFGRIHRVVDFMGRISPTDVGKRIYNVDGVLQVESDGQRAAREKDEK